MADWKKIPTRDELLQSRMLRPFSARLSSPCIWHLNRRGVARGAALGLFAGFAIPIAQTPFAALFAVVARANLPIAAAATFVTNPLTVPFIYYFAFLTGKTTLRLKEDVRISLGADSGLFENIVRWLVTAAGPTYLGLLIFAAISAAIGYFAVHFGWHFWVSQRRRRRLRHRAKRDAASAAEARA